MEKINWREAVEKKILFDKSKTLFYNICSNEENISEFSNYINSKKLNDDSQIDNDLVIAGLLGAIEHNQSNYINELFNIIDSNTNKKHIEAIFNCASKKTNIKLIELIDEKFSIIESLKEIKISRLQVNSDGKIKNLSYWDDIYSIDSHNYNLNIGKYYQNILSFNIRTQNDTVVNLISNKNANDIHTTVIEDLFLDTCLYQNSEALLYLIHNEKFRDIIKKTDSINLFLNENTQHLEVKKEIKSALEMLELSEKLKVNVNIKNNKIKV